MNIKTDRMSSGSLRLVLIEPMSWHKFGSNAKNIIKKIRANLIEKIDTVDERIWKINYKNNLYWIAYDDFQSSITLEPIENKSDEIMNEIAKEIEELIKDI